MSTVIDAQQFLVGKTFRIPPYQRDYAWTTQQVEDLFDDVQEAIDSGTGHYLGTVVLTQAMDRAYPNCRWTTASLHSNDNGASSLTTTRPIGS